MHHLFGVLALVPVALLLTVSFFVLFTRTKTEDATIKSFGLAVAIVLWVAAAVILGAGIVGMACWHHGECGKMGMLMKSGECGPGLKGLHGMRSMMMQEPQTTEPETAPAKEEKKK
jgi:hypothetical protein